MFAVDVCGLFLRYMFAVYFCGRLLRYIVAVDFCGIILREFSKSTSVRVLLLFLRRIFDYELLMMLLYHYSSCVKNKTQRYKRLLDNSSKTSIRNEATTLASVSRTVDGYCCITIAERRVRTTHLLVLMRLPSAGKVP